MGKGLPEPNPYAIRGMIRDPARFYGRKREVNEIIGRLVSMQSVSVVGERLIGKSSLLYYITETGCKRLDDGYKCYYLDLQRVLSEEEFYERVCEKLGRSGNTHIDFEHALEETTSKCVVLCLDEFEQTADNPNFGDDFFNVLRSLAQIGKLALVVATQHTLSDLYSSGDILTSAFHNIFSFLPIGELSEDEAKELVTVPAERAGHPFEEKEVKFILELAGRHPYWLNLACELLYDAKLRKAEKPEEEVEQLFEKERNQTGRGIVRTTAESNQTEAKSGVKETGIAILIASVLVVIGTIVGGVSIQTSNPVGVFIAAGILIIALGVWVRYAIKYLSSRRKTE